MSLLYMDVFLLHFIMSSVISIFTILIHCMQSTVKHSKIFLKSLTTLDYSHYDKDDCQNIV